MAYIDFPLDHAVQITYNANGQETSRVNVTSGIVKTGYELKTGQNAVFDYLEVPHYKFELWFSIPSDVYKYTSVDYAKFSNESFDYETHDYYYWRSSNPYSSNAWTERSSGSESIYKMGSASSYFQPANLSVQGAKNETIEFADSDFQIIQSSDCDYLVMAVIGNTINYFSSEESGGTTYLSSGTSLYFYDITDLKLTFNFNDIGISIEPVYPVNVYARNDAALTVSWNWSNSVNRSKTYLDLVSSSITIIDSASHSVSYQITGNDTDHVFSVSDISPLSVGLCSVSLSITTNYGTSASTTWSFNLVGESTAPEITSVTAQAFPRIEWSVSSQTAFEIKISNELGVVYETGLIVDGISTYYIIPKMMNLGKYSIEMRCLNEYGIFTAWSSYYWNFNRTITIPSTNTSVSARSDFGIMIKNPSFLSYSLAIYAVRRKDENSAPEVLGLVDSSKTFVDYTIGLNDPYQYTLRYYDNRPAFAGGGGYADADWIDGVLAYKGVVIRDVDDYSNFVHIWMSEEQTIQYLYDDDRSDTLVQCVGRKFYVSEVGEWQTSVRQFSGYVSDDDFEKLNKMKIKSRHVLMQAQKEFFPCHMAFSDRGEYTDKGRIVNFQMTRIDGDEYEY